MNIKRILLPILGGLTGHFLGSTFMNPRYFYFRYMFNFVFCIIGNGFANNYFHMYWDSFNMLNMHLYPEEVKLAF